MNLAEELNSVASADLIHVDVMDNHFVPNLTFGPPVVSQIQAITPKPLDVHLMIENVDRWAPNYAEIGAFSVTFHLEATKEPFLLAKRLREIGARAGIAIKPGTAVEPLLEHLAEFDQLLVMTVEPGFGGQKLIEDTLYKVSTAKQRIVKDGAEIWLQVDGGIDESNIARVADLGADTFVAGSAVFGKPERSAQIENLRRLAEEAAHHH